MKRLLLLATVFASVVLSSCSKTDIGNDIPKNRGINFSGTTLDTKATMDPNSYKFSWVGRVDKIGIVAKDATGSFYTSNSVEYTVTNSGESSPFASETGIDWNGAGEHTFYASSPVGTFAKNKFAFNLPQTQTQTAADNHDHVGASAIMLAKTTATAGQQDAIALAFKHEMAFVEFRVSAATQSTLTISSIKAEATSIYAGKISFDLAAEEKTSSIESQANEVSLGFTTGMPVTTAVQKGWLAILPGTYASLKFTITYSDGQTQEIVKTPKLPATDFIIKPGALLPVGLTAAPTEGGEEPEPTQLCSAGEGNGTWGQLCGFTVGDKTVSIAKEDAAYIDGTATTIAKVSAGNEILVGARNNDGASQYIHSAAYVDWNLDGNLETSERVGYQASKSIAASTTISDFLRFTLAAPEGTPSGKYFMRVYVSHDDTPAGCGQIESRTTYDLAINYTSNEDPSAPAQGRISAGSDGLKINVKDAPAVTAFTVSLTKRATTPVIINLQVTSDNTLTGTLSASPVTIPAGDLSTTATITFSNSDFTTDKSANVTVTASSSDVNMQISSITYVVKGPVSAQDIGLTLEAMFGDYDEFDGVYDFSAGKQILMMGNSETVPEMEPICDFAVTGTLTKEDVSIEWANEKSSPLYDGGQYGYNYITIHESAKGKTGTIAITSTNTIISPDFSITFTEIK